VIVGLAFLAQLIISSWSEERYHRRLAERSKRNVSRLCE
jgi:hypothetical protein